VERVERAERKRTVAKVRERERGVCEAGQKGSGRERVAETGKEKGKEKGQAIVELGGK
jgi:hypothetical protein